MLYEALLLIAVAFFAGSLFLFASGGHDATGWYRTALQCLVALTFTAYFLWCWLRGGQTLPMKAWKIRVVDITPARALLRLVYALLFVPTGISVIWSFIDREKQFLHDRLAGTRLIFVQPTTS